MGVSVDCPFVSGTGTPYYLAGTGKATHFKFGQYIQRVHPNKRLMLNIDYCLYNMRRSAI